MDLLDTVWGSREGFACFATRDKDTPWQDRYFYWPSQREEVEKYVQAVAESEYELHWSPQLYTRPDRRHETITGDVRWIGADCDEADPQLFHLRPAVVWTSSPARFQCLWMLDNGVSPTEGDELSRILTYRNCCDHGGYSLSHMLRFPGTRNHKYQAEVRSELVYCDRSGEGVSPQTVRQSISLDVRLFNQHNVPAATRALYTNKSDDRSAALYAFEAGLLRAGLSAQETFILARASANNKYAGRRDASDCLWREIHKLQRELESSKKQDAITPGGFVSLYKFLAMPHEEPGWLIDGIWMKQSHGIIAGEPKTYKSVISTEIAVSVATGTHFMGQFEAMESGPVLYMHEEDTPSVVKSRILKMLHARGLGIQCTFEGESESSRLTSFSCAPEPAIHILSNRGICLDDGAWLSYLEAKLVEYAPKLVILDPLYLMLGGIDENSAKEMRPLLNWLLHLKYRHKCSVLIVHHYRKGEATRGGQRMLGSTTLHAWTESSMYTRAKQDLIHVEREFRAFKKGDLSMALDLGDPRDMSYTFAVTDVQKGGSKDAELLRYLGDGTRLTMSELMSRMACDEKEVRKAIKEAGVVSDRDPVSHEMQYHIPF